MISKTMKIYNRERYIPILQKYGAICKTAGVYEFDDLIIYPGTAWGHHKNGNGRINITEILEMLKNGINENVKEKAEEDGIYCYGCDKNVQAKLVKGDVIYPHRQDLHKLNFYQCECGLFVGCHPNSTKALGCITTKEVREARRHIHELIDPLWKKQHIKRKWLYIFIRESLPHSDGKDYHTGNIRTIEEAREVYRVCLKIKKTLTGEAKSMQKGSFIGEVKIEEVS